MGFTRAITRSSICDVFRYWVGLATSGSPPGVNDLDPAAIDPAILPWLFLFRREDAGFRCVLSGTEIRQVDGYDATGARLDDLYWARSHRQHRELFEEVLRSALPLYYTGARRTSGDTQRGFASLLMPLCGRAGIVDHVFGVLQVERPEPVLPGTGDDAGRLTVVRPSPREIGRHRGAGRRRDPAR